MVDAPKWVKSPRTGVPVPIDSIGAMVAERVKDALEYETYAIEELKRAQANLQRAQLLANMATKDAEYWRTIQQRTEEWDD